MLLSLLFLIWNNLSFFLQNLKDNDEFYRLNSQFLGWIFCLWYVFFWELFDNKLTNDRRQNYRFSCILWLQIRLFIHFVDFIIKHFTFTTQFFNCLASPPFQSCKFGLKYCENLKSRVSQFGYADHWFKTDT